MTRAADTLALFRDPYATVPVVYGSRAFRGFLERDQEQQLDVDGRAGVIARARVLTVATASVPGLAAGDAITVSGTTYTVRDHAEQDDGLVTRIYLRG